MLLCHLSRHVQDSGHQQHSCGLPGVSAEGRAQLPHPHGPLQQGCRRASLLPRRIHLLRPQGKPPPLSNLPLPLPPPCPTRLWWYDLSSCRSIVRTLCHTDCFSLAKRRQRYDEHRQNSQERHRGELHLCGDHRRQCTRRGQARVIRVSSSWTAPPPRSACAWPAPTTSPPPSPRLTCAARSAADRLHSQPARSTADLPAYVV